MHARLRQKCVRIGWSKKNEIMSTTGILQNTYYGFNLWRVFLPNFKKINSGSLFLWSINIHVFFSSFLLFNSSISFHRALFDEARNNRQIKSYNNNVKELTSLFISFTGYLFFFYFVVERKWKATNRIYTLLRSKRVCVPYPHHHWINLCCFSLRWKNNNDGKKPDHLMRSTNVCIYIHNTHIVRRCNVHTHAHTWNEYWIHAYKSNIIIIQQPQSRVGISLHVTFHAFLIRLTNNSNDTTKQTRAF